MLLLLLLCCVVFRLLVCVCAHLCFARATAAGVAFVCAHLCVARATVAGRGLAGVRLRRGPLLRGGLFLRFRVALCCHPRPLCNVNNLNLRLLTFASVTGCVALS